MNTLKRILPLTSFTVIALAGISCKSRSGAGTRGQLEASNIPASQKVIAGTDEAADNLKYHPDLNQEWAYDPKAEEVEFSILADMVRLLQETLQPQHSPTTDKVLRGFHAKAHGCLAAQFYVLDRPTGLPQNMTLEETRVGLFSGKHGGMTKDLPAGISRMYPGLIRFSSAQGKRGSDTSPDGKGMALKLFVNDANGQPTEQDFTMSDTPICNATTASRFMAFGAALAGLHQEFKTRSPQQTEMDPNAANSLLGNIDNFEVVKSVRENLEFKQKQLGERFPPSLRFLLTPDNGATRQGVLEILSGSIGKTNSAQLQYWSRTPYHLDRNAVKFTMMPQDCCSEGSGFEQLANCPQRKKTTTSTYFEYAVSSLQSIHDGFQSVATTTGNQIRKLTNENSFREALTESAKAPICYNFAYQFQNDPVNMPTENPTVPWDPSKSQPVVFAKVVLPAQTFNSDEQAVACEQSGWTPEHFLPEHKPMGHLNRARLAVYKASREFRNTGVVPKNAREYPVTLIGK